MRPLIVLVLVLLAAAGIVLGMVLFGDEGGGTGKQAVGPGVAAPVAPARSTGPGPNELASVDGGDGRARGTVDVPLPAVADENLVGRPGQGNRLVGRVVDANGAPLVGARLSLSSEPMMGDALVLRLFQNSPTEVAPVVVKTDAAGTYAFRDVTPRSDYYLKAEHPDFASVQEQLVNVGERGEFEGPDIVMQPGSQLTGYVTDIGGNAVPDAELLLDSAYYSDWTAQSPDRMKARTDHTGYYEIKNVSAGPRNLLVRAEGYGVQVKTGNELIFKGEPGETREISFTLEPGFPIVGHVYDPEGLGVPDAKVSAVHFQNQTSSRGEATTDAQGRFQIDNLRNGQYIMMVQAPGYTQGRLNRVAAGKVDVVIDLKRQACVPGRVLADGGLPKLDITLQRTSPKISPNSTQIFEETNIAAQLDAGSDGNFRLCGVEPGYYLVTASGEGYAPTPSNTFQVVEGQDPPPVSVTLIVGGALRGRVVDNSGAPIANAVITSRDRETPDSGNDAFFGSLISSPATERTVRTNGEGEFVVPNLAPGKYKVVVEHGDFAGATITDLDVADGRSVDVPTITLGVGGTVRGTVVAGGSPVTRGFLQLYSTTEVSRSYQARTDSSGQFEIRHVRPGSYKLTATRSSPTASNDPFQAILDQQASEVVLSVVEGGTLSRELNLGG